MKNHNTENYTIKLPIFDGPFDLLLFFIERDEIDIRDIPIAKITNDFLGYLIQLEKMNIDIAGEFILVAATLMRIKSKMLIPRLELNDGSEETDNREALIRHLMIYKSFKEIVPQMDFLESERMKMGNRENMIDELRSHAKKKNEELESEAINSYKLMTAFQRVLIRNEPQNIQQLNIDRVPYTIREQKNQLLDELKEIKKISFDQLIQLSKKSRVLLVVNFLSILELLQEQKISLVLGEGYNNFWIQRDKNGDSSNY